MKIELQSIDLAKYILPAEIFNYFCLCKVDEVRDELHFYFDELHTCTLYPKGILVLRTKYAVNTKYEVFCQKNIQATNLNPKGSTKNV